MKFSTVKPSRPVVCACTVVMQCETSEALRVTFIMSRMCVLLLGLNCTLSQHLYCCFVVA